MKFLIISLKLGFSFCLIFFVCRRIDFDVFFATITLSTAFKLIAVCSSIMVLQTLLSGYRLKIILSLFKYHLSNFAAFNLLLIGNFFSQTMFSFFGGDAMRIVALNRSGIAAQASLKAVFLDRVSGFIALQILFIIAMPFLLLLIADPNFRYGINLLAICSIILIAGFFGLGLIPRLGYNNKLINKLWDIGQSSKYLLATKSKLINVLILSVLVHLSNVVVIYICINMLGGALSLSSAFVIGIPVMLLTMLPISVGGWGVRESSMVYGLGLVGVASDQALLTAITMGLAALIASLPGVFLIPHKHHAVKYSYNNAL